MKYESIPVPKATANYEGCSSVDPLKITLLQKLSECVQLADKSEGIISSINNKLYGTEISEPSVSPEIESIDRAIDNLNYLLHEIERKVTQINKSLA